MLVLISSYHTILLCPPSLSLPPALPISAVASDTLYMPQHSRAASPEHDKALRSDHDANHILIPLSLSPSWEGWRWWCVAQAWSCQEAKCLCGWMLRREGYFTPMDKCMNMKVGREGKQMTLSGQVYFAVQNCEVVPLCAGFPAAPCLIRQDQARRAALLLPINSWVSLLKSSFLPYPVLLHCVYLLLVSVLYFAWPSPGNKPFVFCASAAWGKRAGLLRLLLCFSRAIHCDWTEVGLFWDEWFFMCDNHFNTLQLCSSV